MNYMYVMLYITDYICSTSSHILSVLHLDGLLQVLTACSVGTSLQESATCLSLFARCDVASLRSFSTPASSFHTLPSIHLGRIILLSITDNGFPHRAMTYGFSPLLTTICSLYEQIRFLNAIVNGLHKRTQQTMYMYSSAYICDDTFNLLKYSS